MQDQIYVNQTLKPVDFWAPVVNRLVTRFGASLRDAGFSRKATSRVILPYLYGCRSAGE